MAKIFISYSTKDAKFADRLYEFLDESGHKVWLDREELKGGQRWLKEIEKHILWADALIVLWSENASDSRWVGDEIQFARSNGKHIIPLRIDDIDPASHILVNALQIIDARGRKFNQALEEVNVALADLNDADDSAPDESQPDSESIPASTPAAPSLEGKLRMDRKSVVNITIAIAGLILAFMALFPQDWRDNVLHGLGLIGPSPTPVITAPTPTESPTTVSPVPPTSTATFTPEPANITATFTPTRADVSVSEAATLETLNAWRQQNGFSPLESNEILQAIATRHVSYLSSVPLPLLEETDIYEDANGQNIQRIAMVEGYAGSRIELFVLISEPNVSLSLDDMLVHLSERGGSDVHRLYNEVGFDNVLRTTGKTYLVVVLGEQSP